MSFVESLIKAALSEPEYLSRGSSGDLLTDGNALGLHRCLLSAAVVGPSALRG